MKTLTQRIDLHGAFHHQGPGHQRALGHGPGTMALVATQVRQPCAQGTAPGDGAPIVAGVARKGGVLHLG